MGPNVSDEKDLARQEVQRPDTQRLLRQFLKLESGLGNSKKFVTGWERVFGERAEKFTKPLQCSDCAFKAEDRKDVDWHIDQNPGHLFWLPGKEK